MEGTYGLEAFVVEVRHAISRRLPARETLAMLTPGFKRLLADLPQLLPPAPFWPQAPFPVQPPSPSPKLLL